MEGQVVIIMAYPARRMLVETFIYLAILLQPLGLQQQVLTKPHMEVLEMPF